MSVYVTFTINGFFGFFSEPVTLTSGVLDERAEEVFTHGHCHSLAIALREITGLPIVLAASADREVWHVGIKDRGDFVDIRGRRPCTLASIFDLDDEEVAGGTLAEHSDTRDLLKDLHERYACFTVQVDDATPFAIALIDREQITLPTQVHSFTAAAA